MNVGLSSPDNIEKERDYERIYKMLQKEFDKMDTSGDGTLDKSELIAFLIGKAKEHMSGVDEETIQNQFSNLADEMFGRLDIDGNGTVYLNEFVEFYFTQQRTLMERIEELKLQIQDAENRSGQIDLKIKDLQP